MFWASSKLIFRIRKTSLHGKLSITLIKIIVGQDVAAVGRLMMSHMLPDIIVFHWILCLLLAFPERNAARSFDMQCLHWSIMKINTLA